ncbi:hypothetical protein B0T26DRAFT_346207 [Lasiosphaeria miniovina]|uniref:Uncharacterized protein n=1 Tax=Lasiosphaeria miniovina TaxID=1954250 RepID=A0AA40DQX4_9PEZI|nr:uncharacterized protein B0T26DRAFT_346207 [Lasiosphaeria miniovina]KAK0712849.1 hypothetical protein B0T26DRAFT_346207 [Lasiosphaeria miniovina]
MERHKVSLPRILPPEPSVCSDFFLEETLDGEPPPTSAPGLGVFRSRDQNDPARFRRP